MEEKKKRGEKEKSGMRVWLPIELKKELEKMKIHRRQPLYEVIEGLLRQKRGER